MLVISYDFSTILPTMFAYLDPGSGSFALQMVLASVFGGVFALKQSWSGVKAWFTAKLG